MSYVTVGPQHRRKKKRVRLEPDSVARGRRKNLTGREMEINAGGDTDWEGD